MATLTAKWLCNVNLYFVSVILFLLKAYAQIPDDRCFLETGGSAESFFVSEDLPVGSTIGALHIVGDPSERGGNIVLRLQELDSPVRIAPGTKNLTLARRLDKEGKDGPSSVYVNVICDRKRTQDPGIRIPVNIRVTDANDNAPQFLNSPYVLNISEVTVVGTRVLQGVKAEDADQQGPYSTVQYTVLPGPHSDYFIFINGLEGTLLLRKPLDYETLSNFTLMIRAQDQGTPPQYSDTVLYVNVIDADDQNPRFYDDRYTAVLPDLPLQGVRLLVLPREIQAFDQDLGINAPIFYTFNSAGSDYRFFEIDRASGHVLIKRTIPDDELLQPATLVVKATQYDNPDRYALTTLTINRAGSRVGELQFVQRMYSTEVLESVPLGSVLLTVITNKPRDKRVRFWLEDPDHSGTFSITQTGDVVLRKALDYEVLNHYNFIVHASDSYSNDSAVVNITVLNVNDWDPRFRYPQYEFFVPDLEEITKGFIIGRVEAADGDKDDEITLSLRGSASNMFSINPNGDIILEDLSPLNSSTANLVAVATDTGYPPREASVPVIVHFPEALVRAQSSVWAPGSSGFVLLLLGCLLAILGLIILVLIIYIYKHKRTKSRTNQKLTSYGNGLQHDKLGNPAKMDNPIFSQDTSNPQYTATVKSIISHGAGGRSLGNKRQVAPTPPQVPVQAETRPVTPTDNKVSWPHGSIPRRVKKLSWDDEHHHHSKPELDPEVSVTPLTAQDDRASDQMNLTVYF